MSRGGGGAKLRQLRVTGRSSAVSNEDTEEGEAGGVCAPRVFYTSKIPSFLARWRVPAPSVLGKTQMSK
jgi:hypothetical protein